MQVNLRRNLRYLGKNARSIACPSRIDNVVYNVDSSESFKVKPYANADKIDFEKLREYRIGRIRNELSKRQIGAALLFDPVNIRYATDTRNMSIFTMRFFGRYCFIAADGPCILFEYFNCEPFQSHIKQIDEIRPAVDFDYTTAVNSAEENATKFAKEILELLNKHCDGNKILAVDTCQKDGLFALQQVGINVFNGKIITDRAKVIKCPDEIICMKTCVDVAEKGIKTLRENMTAGITEQELWAHLHKVNIESGGEWIETRLLTSGIRTNPWLQECSNKVIEKGDIVAFDTDMVGPYGYCCDMSRTFVEGDKFSSDQKRLYEIAVNQIEHNASLLKDGLHFKEFTEKSFELPKQFLPNRYPNILHGVGLTDEFPFVLYPCDNGHLDDYFQENMVVSVESYIGEDGGHEGVKLEQQYLLTKDGVELLTKYPNETF